MLSAGMSADDLDALARASTTSSLDVAGRRADAATRRYCVQFLSPMMQHPPTHERVWKHQA